jgi:UDP-N-acetylmuramate dehydrogenase
MNDRAVKPGLVVNENAALDRRTTFRVPAQTKYLIEVSEAHALAELFRHDALKNEPTLILGGGSNILFTRDWAGVVLSIATRGIHMLEERGDSALLRVEAGENWNEFVRWSLAQGFSGVENLSLIPGTVGAAPIQNIGAYGVEVSEFVHKVAVFDRATKTFAHLSNSDCQFAYRDSLFKREPDRHIVVAVEFLLSRTPALRLDYAGMHEELAAMQVEKPTSSLVAEAVCRLRLRKLPNPAVIGNAGSFFKNPRVDAAVADALRSAHPALVCWPAIDGQSKLSAAWLIEACGFKGVREGDAGVSSQHALVLVNHGHATGAQIWALAQRIQDTVERRFGVRLEPEPVVI